MTKYFSFVLMYSRKLKKMKKISRIVLNISFVIRIFGYFNNILNIKEDASEMSNKNNIFSYFLYFKTVRYHHFIWPFLMKFDIINISKVFHLHKSEGGETFNENVQLGSDYFSSLTIRNFYGIAFVKASVL